MTPPILDLDRFANWFLPETFRREIVFSHPLSDEIRSHRIPDETLADLIRAAGVPRESIAEVFLKLSGRDIPDDPNAAARYIKRVARNIFLDEMRRQAREGVFACEPDDQIWDGFASEPSITVGWDNAIGKEKLGVLIEIGIAMLSPHERQLVRLWAARPNDRRVSVAAIHAQTREPCGHGPDYCCRATLAKLTRIVFGIGVATGEFSAGVDVIGPEECFLEPPSSNFTRNGRNRRALLKKQPEDRLQG
jgi:hypothetical protein